MEYPSEVEMVRDNYLNLIQSIANLARDCRGNPNVMRDVMLAITASHSRSRDPILDGVFRYLCEEFAASRQL